MKIRLTWPPIPHTRYADTAYDSMIGKQITLNFGTGLSACKATLLTADIEPDGGVAFTLDIEDPETAVVVAAYIAMRAVDNVSVEEPDVR